MVPSDVDVEDKIIGPLTLKQLIYFAIGAMIIFIFYTIFSKVMILFIILSLPVAGITFAFIFYKFNEQPFEQFLPALIAFYTKPAKRIWNRDTTLEDIHITSEPERKIELPKTHKKKITRLDELAYVLDSRGWQAREQNNDKPKENK